MALYLVQHGKNLSKDVDPEKGLSDEGKNEVRAIAALAKEYRLHVSAIRHSGKKRARETAEIFSGFLGVQGKLEKMEGLAPLDDVTQLDLKAAENLMLVGHLPFMEKLASYLVAGAPDRPPVVKFQNGGIVCLDRDAETDSWYLKWTMLPRID